MTKRLKIIKFIRKLTLAPYEDCLIAYDEYPTDARKLFLCVEQLSMRLNRGCTYAEWYMPIEEIKELQKIMDNDNAI